MDTKCFATDFISKPQIALLEMDKRGRKKWVFKEKESLQNIPALILLPKQLLVDFSLDQIYQD